MQPYVFISYSHNDSLIDSLEQIFNHVGINYWFDSFIKPASNWKTVISDRISQCKLFFIVITSTSMLSEYVIEELSIAYKNGKKIFPLFIDDPVIPDSVPDDLAALIERIQYLRIKKCDLVALTVEVQRSIINSINDVMPISDLRIGSLSKPKIIVFDFDGTLANPKSRNTWELLWESVGYSVNDCDELEKEIVQSKQSYQVWCDRSLEKFAERKMSIETVLKAAEKIKKINYLDETLKILVDKGIKLYILSGSVSQLINAVLQEATDYFEHIEANNFQFDENGRLIHIEATKYNYRTKPEYIYKIAKENGVLCREILYIGNSMNDRFVYLSGAQTLCINPIDVDYTDTNAWTTYIRKVDDFRQILNYIL